MAPPPKLEQGSPDDDYPLNDMASADFNVGGVRRILPPEQQLEQLVSYLDSTYPVPDLTAPWAGGTGDPGPGDRYVAKLPDRITHAAMLMLGTAVDHAMPGVAFARGVTTSQAPGGLVLHPSKPTGRWAVSLHSGGWWRGSGEALDFQWRPEVAAAAELSGTTILDLDYPLAPQHRVEEIDAEVARAIDWVRGQGASSVTAWGYSSGAALAAMQASRVDALVLTFPDLDSVRTLTDRPVPLDWPRALVQIALRDEVAKRPSISEATLVKEYMSTHRISTPEVARQRIRDVAEFLSAASAN